MVIAEVERCQFDQWVVASFLGVAQQRVSALLLRRIALFNAETLIEMLDRFGVQVDVVETRRIRPRFFGWPDARPPVGSGGLEPPHVGS